MISLYDVRNEEGREGKARATFRDGLTQFFQEHSQQTTSTTNPL
jgi:hypothetical protein